MCGVPSLAHRRSQYTYTLERYRHGRRCPHTSCTCISRTIQECPSVFPTSCGECGETMECSTLQTVVRLVRTAPRAVQHILLVHEQPRDRAKNFPSQNQD